MTRMGDFLRAEVAAGRGYLPAGEHVLRAFSQPLDAVRVLIVGQDPYPTPGHAGRPVASRSRPRCGPCRAACRTSTRSWAPTSACRRPPNGDLSPWADQGVLLLNRVLTVRPGAAASHRGKGWEAVTGRAIEALVARGGPLVAILWGRDAQTLGPGLADVPRIESAHPSPLSASGGFFGSRPFSRANDLLRRAGRRPDRLEPDMTSSPSREREPRRWSRYVAVGDSFTEGMSDADPQVAGPLRRLGRPPRRRTWPWPGRRTSATPTSRCGGGCSRDIAGRQVDDALALGPDLVSIVGGGNDILRPKADIDALAGELEAAVARIRATGADVLMATPVDPQEAPLVRHTRGRAAIYTAHIWTIARRHDAFVIDQWGMTALRDWRLWAADRIHMTAEGHRRVALNAFTSLGFATEDADWSTPLPPAPSISRADAVRANAQWAREYVGPWVQRRLRGQSSGDAVSAKRPTSCHRCRPRPDPSPPSDLVLPSRRSGP